MCLSSPCKALKISGTKDDWVLLACHGLILQNAKPLPCLRMLAKACIPWLQGKITMTRLPIFCTYFAGRGHGQTRVGQIWRYHSFTSSTWIFRALQSLDGLLQWHPLPHREFYQVIELWSNIKRARHPSTIWSISNPIQFFIYSVAHGARPWPCCFKFFVLHYLTHRYKLCGGWRESPSLSLRLSRPLALPPSLSKTSHLRMNSHNELQYIGGWTGKHQARPKVSSPTDLKIPQKPPSASSLITDDRTPAMLQVLMKQGEKEKPWSSTSMRQKWYDDCFSTPRSSCILDNCHCSISSAYNMGAIMIYSVSVLGGFGRWAGILWAWLILENWDERGLWFWDFSFVQIMLFNANIDHVSCCALKDLNWKSFTCCLLWSTWVNVNLTEDSRTGPNSGTFFAFCTCIYMWIMAQ